jgi:hypothetical protein
VAGPSSPAQAQLTMVFAGSGIPTGAVCTLGITKDEDSLTLEDLVALADLMKPCQLAASCGTCILSYIDMKLGPNETGATYTTSVNQPGGFTSNQAPPNVCTIVEKQIANLSSRFSGRMFWPGPPEGDITEAGRLGTPLQQGIQTAWTGFQFGAANLGITPVVFSRSPAHPATFSLVESFQVQSTVATQRHRLRR